MYDYRDEELFDIPNIDHELEYVGIKYYQFPILASILIVGMKQLFYTLALVFVMVILFRWMNKRAKEEKHLTLHKKFLKVCWKIKPLSLVFSHINDLTPIQIRYRS